MNRDLFLSILAMDSYNRGYGAGLAGLPVEANVTKLGSATIVTDSVVEIGATAETAGFYAIAYELDEAVDTLAAHKTIISIRGTDKISFNPFTSDSDVWNGWTLGAGLPAASQGRLSLDFFEDVMGRSVFDATLDDVEITGHSLGGGDRSRPNAECILTFVGRTGNIDDAMTRSLLLALLLPLAACATVSPEARVRAALLDAGLSPRMAGCMAERMVDRLSIPQLRRLQSLARLPDRDIGSLSIDQFLHQVRALKEPEIFVVVSKAGLGCAIAI